VRLRPPSLGALCPPTHAALDHRRPPSASSPAPATTSPNPWPRPGEAPQSPSRDERETNRRPQCGSVQRGAWHAKGREDPLLMPTKAMILRSTALAGPSSGLRRARHRGRDFAHRRTRQRALLPTPWPYAWREERIWTSTPRRRLIPTRLRRRHHSTRSSCSAPSPRPNDDPWQQFDVPVGLRVRLDS
jgi:hypothetical protein